MSGPNATMLLECICRAMVYALHLADGSTVQGWPVDVETGEPTCLHTRYPCRHAD